MYKIFKVDKNNYPNLFCEEIDKYVLTDNKEVIGIGTINNNNDKNKINIMIDERYRGNGYGKILFQKISREYINQYGIENLKFEISKYNTRFINILLQSGGIQIDNTNDVLLYVLPLGKWSKKYDEI